MIYQRQDIEDVKLCVDLIDTIMHRGSEPERKRLLSKILEVKKSWIFSKYEIREHQDRAARANKNMLV